MSGAGRGDPYEREQENLLKLWDEFSSSDEKVDPYHDSNDGSDPDYQPNDSSDSDAEKAGPSSKQAILLSQTLSDEDDFDAQSGMSGLDSPQLSDAERENNDDEPESLWQTTTAPIPNFDFDESSVGVKINIDENSTPLDVFNCLFTPQILEYVVQCSNDYGELLGQTNRPKTRNSRSANYRPITIDEMKAFFGLCLLQGQVSTNNVRRFFSYKDVLFYHPIFPFVMSSRRFEQILRVLCSSPPKSKGKEKVQTLLDMLVAQYQNSYGPTKELSLDESLLHFRGRLGFRVYIKNKKNRYGIKFYELTTSDGYVLNLEMYSGSGTVNNTNGDNGETGNHTVTEKVVLRLMQPYLLKGHELYMDNYYNSIPLSEKLLKLRTHTNGTLRSNRRGNPKLVVSKKLKRGEHFWMRKNQVYVSKWKDKRDVLVLTTKTHPRMIAVKNKFGREKNKPEEVATYNEHMSGIDRCDQMISTYNATRKTIRWYKKVILYLVDMSAWNAFFLYRKYCKGNSRKYRFVQFRDELIKSLINLPPGIEGRDMVLHAHQNHNSRRFKPTQTNDNLHVNQDNNTMQELKCHWPEKIPGTPGGQSQKKSIFLKCRMCTKNKLRKETSYRCKGCREKPPLCPSCFEEWHTSQE